MPVNPTSSPALVGDEAVLYAQHADALLRSVGRAVNTSDAVIEDACATAWMIFLRRQPDREFTFGWLRTTAIREAIRADQRARALASLDADCPPPMTGTPTARYESLIDQLDAGDDEQRILAREALRRVAALPPRQRAMFAHHVAGHDYDEIAALTGDSLRTVDRQLRRAREAIRWNRAE